MAAVLAAGFAAAAAGGCAAAIYGLCALPGGPLAIHTPCGSGRKRPGLRIIRSAELKATDLTVVRNIPVTSLPRTLLDVSASEGETRLRELVARAQRRRPVDRKALAELIGRSAGRRGVAALRAIAADLAPGAGIERIGLEQAFLRLCDRFDIASPVVNGLIRLEHRTIQVDFQWPDARLVVETDGRGSHSDLVSYEEDRRRDQELAQLGWTVLRFTYRQVKLEPARVARIVVEMLEESPRQLPSAE